jgi:hypothetical protein
MGHMQGGDVPRKQPVVARPSVTVPMMPICLRVIWLWCVTLIIQPCMAKQCASVCLAVEFTLFIFIACFRIHDYRNWTNLRGFLANCLTSSIVIMLVSALCRQLNLWRIALGIAVKAHL